MDPLDLLTPDPPGRFGKAPEWNAYVELHNVVAAAASAVEFGPSDRVRISERHGVDLSRAFADERRGLYQTVLDHRLRDGDLSGPDRHLLGHLARTLALSAADLRPVHERAFGVAVTQAIADDCLSVDERLLLFKLQHLLGLDPRVAEGAYDILARERLLRVVAAALCDGELSPEEDAEIERVRQALSLEPPAGFEAMLEQARIRYQTRRGRLPEVEAPVPLPARETARMTAPIRWSGVDGPALRTAIGPKALQSGRTSGKTVPDRVFKGRQAVGDVILTDRRILLRAGAQAPREIRLSTLAQILRFRNGTVVRTKVDRYVYLDPGDRNEAFYAVLHRLLFGAPKPVPAGRFVAKGARWRRVLDVEERRRGVRWFGTVSQTELAERLAEAPVTWTGAGSVFVDATRLVLDDPRRRQTASLSTITSVVRHEDTVWVRRQRAHNWLIECASEADAKRLHTALVEAT
ncbi:hypothetical protein [Rubrivirga sp. IMCC45206]|uniref:hypothetical protein n=1 Tax=Rubrivirga sp. IMCC45206 TaxID=3391614 RepID=UPI00398FACF5